MARKVISLRLDPETIDMLDRAATAAGQTRTGYLEALLVGAVSPVLQPEGSAVRNTEIRNTEAPRNTPCSHPNAELKSWGRWCPDCRNRI